MEAPGNNQVPIQCRSGCGFYGTSATEGMCSKCYKDYLKKRQAPPSGPSGPSFRGEPMSSPSCIDTASPTVPVIIPAPLKESAGADPKIKSDAAAGGPLAAAVATTEDAAAAAAADACVSQEDGGPNCASTSNEAQACTDDSPDKKKKNRCVVCRKKLGLTGFGCRCGGLFCAMHRYSDKHECSFDYRTHGAEEIRKNNPVIKGEKVKQI